MHRIFYSFFAKTFEPQKAGIALSAGEPVRRGIVTTVCERKIETKLGRLTNDFGFRKFDQRCVNFEGSPFDACLGPKISQGLKRFDECRTAVRVATVIDCIDAEKNVSGRDHFRPGERISEKDSVARWHVGDRNSMRDFCFRTLLRYIDGVCKS